MLGEHLDMQPRPAKLLTVSSWNTENRIVSLLRAEKVRNTLCYQIRSRNSQIHPF